MKTKLKLATALLLLAAPNLQLSVLFAQGSLTPPGAPAPTMKSLDQIEARTPITNTASLVTISQPGSYYLTHNLTVSTGDGIDITANGVTLDLNGFTIASTAASATGYGILLAGGLSDITICNGHVRGGVTNNGSGVYSGGGFNYGIIYSGSAPMNVLVSRISVSGCLNHGIYLGYGNTTVVVEACTVRTMGSSGIVASTVKGCSALDCASYGILGDEVSDCRGLSSGNGYGIYANFTAQNSYGSSSTGTGLNAATAQNCYGYSGSGTGLNSGGTALNCYGQSNGGGYGVNAITAQNCYGSSVSFEGLSAAVANNCYGYGSGLGTGLHADNSAQNCYGYSQNGTGLSCLTAINCHGVTHTTTGYTGLFAGSSAIGSFGEANLSGTALLTQVAFGCQTSGGGIGLQTTIANSCLNSATTNSISYKYNMP